jgi:hypothetical protein
MDIVERVYIKTHRNAINYTPTVVVRRQKGDDLFQNGWCEYPGTATRTLLTKTPSNNIYFEDVPIALKIASFFLLLLTVMD